MLQLGVSKSPYKALSWPTILPEESLWKLSKGLQGRGISLWPDRSTSQNQLPLNWETQMSRNLTLLGQAHQPVFQAPQIGDETEAPFLAAVRAKGNGPGVLELPRPWICPLLLCCSPQSAPRCALIPGSPELWTPIWEQVAAVGSRVERPYFQRL